MVPVSWQVHAIWHKGQFRTDRGEFTFLIRILIDGRNNLLPVPPQYQLKYPVGRLNHQLSESIEGV
jgi:hypothetical protein